MSYSDNIVTLSRSELSLALSKAEVLNNLCGRLNSASILPLSFFTFGEWKRERYKHIDAAKQLGAELIVRSSCLSEDNDNGSQAGKYTSLLNVKNTTEALRHAISEVFTSYGNAREGDQVFIQPMLDTPDFVGVAFNREPSSNGNYYVVSADTTGDTQSVTSGADSTIQNWFIRHDAKPDEKWLVQLLELFEELHSLYGKRPLDIEFAIKKNKLYLLQVRPLVLAQKQEIHENQENIKQYELELSCIEKKLRRMSTRHPYLCGEQTLFGVMPDWNPAEIIGIKPKPLALSLYKELVTDRVWAQQRFNYGYRNVYNHPLLLVLGGTPFVDIRASFNSFIPNTLEDALAEKLVNHYLHTLKASPHLHDKVEFSVVLSCFNFGLDSQLKELEQCGFNKSECDEIQRALVTLTDNVITDKNSVFHQDIKKIDELEKRQAQIMQSDLNKIDKVYWLIEDCKNFGTLPFAGLARAGFIAIQLLKSMCDSKLITQYDYDSFLHSIKTVSSALLDDSKTMQRDLLIKKYGHLRPGTYDITSKRYDEEPDSYFSTTENFSDTSSKFALSLEQLNNINEALSRSNLSCNAITLFNFIKSAIEAREYGKFIFSRSLSQTLVLIEQLGSQVGFSRDDLAFVDIKEILRLQSTSHSATATLASSITLGKEYYQMCQKIKLPALIRHPCDAQFYQVLAEEPNYVTSGCITAPVCTTVDPNAVTGKIIFIEAADPGFDWLFSYEIAGLVTQFGGLNSHMAIRAQELNVPAVIGAGEWWFKRWKNAKTLKIDCQCQKVHIIS
ncbi:phosphoenolpyruvate synthase [Alteromonas sp. 345S023]|uniref:Phosphoenolpyruvate synthase n=1 Tax=Alteromonas profundi TaxID=2696062 RepID=A0A7X5LJ07_9ALTE|nr:PEP/pyruvate-binding domain-containing protein [Alteromonas profundi]NDV89869.1 phosphoenolpyruvate synthase [Alteromonas profundi]